MEFFTSYYGFIKNIQDYTLISISRFSPNLSIYHEPILAPSSELLMDYKNSKQLKQDEEIYIKRYKEELKKLDLRIILFDIIKKYDSKKIVLLCFEKPTDFCHRHILAEEIENKLSIKVKEIGIDYTNYERKDYKYKLKNTIDLW